MTSRPTYQLGEKDFGHILAQTIKKVWEINPQIKRIQEKLLSGLETIDDFILNDGDSGFE